VQLTRLTEEERATLLESSRKNVLSAEMSDLIGFRKVMDAISQSRKPIVGHNLFLDICHIFHSFYRKLPESVDEFKELVHEAFPSIFDTKYLAQTLVKLQVRRFNLVDCEVHSPWRPL
jgi:poly(A)-specific ribonuclease